MSTARPSCAPDLGHLAGEIAPVLASFPEIAAAYVFGSVARGDARPESDLDLGLVFRSRATRAVDIYWTLADIASQLEGAQGWSRIDVVVLEEQGPIFCHRVLLEGGLVYEADRERRIDFESETLVRAFDFWPTYEIAAREHAGGIRRWLARRRNDP